MHVGWSELKDEERELPQLAFITTKDSHTLFWNGICAEEMVFEWSQLCISS